MEVARDTISDRVIEAGFDTYESQYRAKEDVLSIPARIRRPVPRINGQIESAQERLAKGLPKRAMF